jgi:hypothetical protein
MATQFTRWIYIFRLYIFKLMEDKISLARFGRLATEEERNGRFLAVA